MTEIFDLLPAEDVQELAKSMHIHAKAQSKKNLVNALMKQSKIQCSLFSTNGDRIEKAIMKRYIEVSQMITMDCQSIFHFAYSVASEMNICSSIRPSCSFSPASLVRTGTGCSKLD